MLTGQRFVFVGGDARMLEVVRQVHDEGASVTLIGYDVAKGVPFDVTQADSVAEPFASAGVVVFPMSGIDDDGRVDSKFASQPLIVQERDLGLLRPGTWIFTGIARPRFENTCHRLDLSLVKLMDLDDVAILNSIPTAEGTIALAMEMMDITIHGSRVAVIGFGRCGFTLARNLSALGAHVAVVARRPSDLARISELGLQPVHLRQLKDAVEACDLIINTVPHPILTSDVLDAVPKESVIIDIASRPGGTDFAYAAKQGIQAKLAPSLPGIVAPKTAGRILATTICRMLNDGHEGSTF